jgi:hypothetical protein
LEGIVGVLFFKFCDNILKEKLLKNNQTVGKKKKKGQ